MERQLLKVPPSPPTDATQTGPSDALASLVSATLWAAPRVHRSYCDKDNPVGAVVRASVSATEGDPEELTRVFGLGLRRPAAFWQDYLPLRIWSGDHCGSLGATALCNLIMIRRSAAHQIATVATFFQALRYRAFELYRWYPAGAAEPVKPEDYPSVWPTPLDWPATTSPPAIVSPGVGLPTSSQATVRREPPNPPEPEPKSNIQPLRADHRISPNRRNAPCTPLGKKRGVELQNCPLCKASVRATKLPSHMKNRCSKRRPEAAVPAPPKKLTSKPKTLVAPTRAATRSRSSPPTTGRVSNSPKQISLTKPSASVKQPQPKTSKPGAPAAEPPTARAKVPISEAPLTSRSSVPITEYGRTSLSGGAPKAINHAPIYDPGRCISCGKLALANDGVCYDCNPK